MVEQLKNQQEEMRKNREIFV